MQWVIAMTTRCPVDTEIPAYAQEEMKLFVSTWEALPKEFQSPMGAQ